MVPIYLYLKILKFFINLFQKILKLIFQFFVLIFEQLITNLYNTALLSRSHSLQFFKNLGAAAVIS